MMVRDLRDGIFEVAESPLKALFYSAERLIGDRLFKQSPPEPQSPRLLNLGCGPLKYPGWCNADEYAFKQSLRQREFRPDWRLDITRPWKCRSDFWDGIFSQHVLEHLRYSQAVPRPRNAFAP